MKRSRSQKPIHRIGIIFTIYFLAFVLANRIRKTCSKPRCQKEQQLILHEILSAKLGIFDFSGTCYSLCCGFLSKSLQAPLSRAGLFRLRLTIAILLLFNSVIKKFHHQSTSGESVQMGWDAPVISAFAGYFECFNRNTGVDFYLGRQYRYLCLRHCPCDYFGSLLFWLGRVSNRTGDIITDKKTLTNAHVKSPPNCLR